VSKARRLLESILIYGFKRRRYLIRRGHTADEATAMAIKGMIGTAKVYGIPLDDLIEICTDTEKACKLFKERIIHGLERKRKLEERLRKSTPRQQANRKPYI